MAGLGLTTTTYSLTVSPRSIDSRLSGTRAGSSDGTESEDDAPTSPIPPPPPPDFNPPADLDYDRIDQAISAIASPPPSHDGTPVMSEASSPTLMVSRPSLQALQRVSQDSNRSASPSGFNSMLSPSSIGGMEGQDHLAEMRDRLIESSGSGGPSREMSMEDLMDVSTAETHQVEPIAGPSRHRSASGEEQAAWDSVWPTADTVHRATNTSLAEASRFPIMAPVSPFVTPTFSPAVIGRSSPSRQPHSPQNGPEPPFNSARRRSVSFEPPLLHSPTLSASSINISKHQRSFSSSSATSPTMRQFKSTPPSSPLNRPSSPSNPSPRGPSPNRRRGQSVTNDSRRPPPELRNDDVPPLADRLPPPVETGPIRPFQSKDDSGVITSPLYTPLARPANLRRALSDFDTRAKPNVPLLARSSSLDDKSPKRSPTTADLPSPTTGTEEQRPKKSPRTNPTEIGRVDLVDEGDVLPQEDVYMDVTFEDEGLSTLERIFLLSKSEFPFHRNYIARVLGDLLYDVDPCESVEYILPLISSFPVDEDEGVREAFAQELHRILWYYYATCRVKDGTDDRPYLPVDFFTPLLGSLLLNSNTIVTDSVRTGLVSILSRLKGGEITVERWGADLKGDLDGEKPYPSQTGDHVHFHEPIPDDEREMIETELLNGIVIGMGSLSTELPEEIYADDQADEQELFQAQLLAEATAGQATSMNLIGSLCEFYTGDEAVERGFVEEVLRCADAEVPGRAEGAIALAALAKIVPLDQVARLIPLFEHLSRDESIQVRQSLCVALPALCRRLETDRREFAIEAIHALAPNPDVRNSLLDVLGELIYAFHEDPAGPPAEIMRVYMEEEVDRLGEDWDTVAAFNFPAVVLTLGPSRWPELRNLYARLDERATAKPRRSLAASLHELAKILRPEQCAQDLMPVFHSCLQDTDEIRELVFERLDVFLSHLPLDLAWKTYLELAQGWKTNSLGGWRARERLALHIPAFFKIFSKLMKCEVLDMLNDALLDPFAAVRDAATKGIPESYEVLGSISDIARRFRESLLELGKSPKFRQRLTFVRCLREFVKPPPNRKAFEDFFLPFLPTLARDVVDVRLGLAQSVADLFVVGAYYGNQIDAPKAIYSLARLLADDEAVDVRETVRNVDLNQLHENETVPYEIKSPGVEKRSVTPGDLEPESVKAEERENKKEKGEDEASRRGSLEPANASANTSVPDMILSSGAPSIESEALATPDAENTLASPESDHIAVTEPDDAAPPAKTLEPAFRPTHIRALSSNHLGTLPLPTRAQPARTQSTEMMTHLTRMVLRTPTSEFPPALSPFFSASPHHTPRTPGGGLFPPGSPGSYVSSPSPNEPSHGQDPFSSAFGRATPEMVAVSSPSGSVSSLRSDGG